MRYNIVAVWVCAEIYNLCQNFNQHKRYFLAFKSLKNSLNNSAAINIFRKFCNAAFAPLNKRRDVYLYHLLNASLNHMVSVWIKHDARTNSKQRLNQSFLHLGSNYFNCLLYHPATVLVKSQYSYLLLDYSKHQINLCLVRMFKHFLNHIVTEDIPHKTAVRAKLLFTQDCFVWADLFIQGLWLTVILFKTYLNPAR